MFRIFLYIRGQKTLPFRARMKNGRSVFRSKRPRALARGASLILISTFIFSLNLRAENENEISLSLDEAIVIALRNNPDVLLKTEDIKKAKENIQEAKAGLFPTLNFTGTYSDTRGLYAKDLAQSATQATLKQYLYKGGKTINTIEQSKYNLEVSSALLDKTKLETVLNVKKAFYTLLLAKEFADVNKSILENTMRHLNFIKARYQNGQNSESDILNIESALSSVKQAHTATLNQVESSLALLNNLLYFDKEVRVVPFAQFVYEPKEVAFDEAFLKALKDRPEIRQYEAQSKADEKAIEIAKAETRPSVYASWDYYSRSTTSLTFSPSKAWQDYNIVWLTFSWPIFDGFATRHKVEQAIIDLKETRLTKEKTIKDIALELKNVYLALKNSLEKIGSAEAEAKVYDDAYSSAKEKYQQGIASDIDLADAHLKYQVSLFNKKEAVYDYLIAKSNFQKATGGM